MMYLVGRPVILHCHALMAPLVAPLMIYSTTFASFEAGAHMVGESVLLHPNDAVQLRSPAHYLEVGNAVMLDVLILLML